MVSESLQLSVLRPTFSWVGIHCWFCLQYGRWTCWVTEIFDSRSAFQPHQPPAYIPPVWHPAAQWQRRRQLQNLVVVLAVQFPPLAEAGAESFSHCYDPCFFHFYPLVGIAVEDQIQRYPRARCRAGSTERRGGRAGRHRYDHRVRCELQRDPVLQALSASQEWEGLWREDGVGSWCSLTVTSNSGGWLLPHLGDSTPEPAISGAHLDEAGGFFTALPWVLSTSEGHLSAIKPMAGNSPAPECPLPWHLCWWPVLKYPGTTWAVPDPALGWNREVCCLCHLKRSQRSFKLVGGQQQALVLGAVYSRLCAAEADAMEFSQSWGYNIMGLWCWLVLKTAQACFSVLTNTGAETCQKALKEHPK